MLCSAKHKNILSLSIQRQLHNICTAHISKLTCDLEQNETQQRALFSGIVFHTLVHGWVRISLVLAVGEGTGPWDGTIKAGSMDWVWSMGSIKDQWHGRLHPRAERGRALFWQVSL